MIACTAASDGPLAVYGLARDAPSFAASPMMAG